LLLKMYFLTEQNAYPEVDESTKTLPTKCNSSIQQRFTHRCFSRSTLICLFVLLISTHIFCAEANPILNSRGAAASSISSPSSSAALYLRFRKSVPNKPLAEYGQGVQPFIRFRKSLFPDQSNFRFAQDYSPFILERMTNDEAT